MTIQFSSKFCIYQNRPPSPHWKMYKYIFCKMKKGSTMNSKLQFYLGVRFDKRKNKKAIGKTIND